MIYLILGCSVISSILYRAGGLSQDQPYWIPKWMRHSWVRDWLCPLVCLLPLFIQHPSWWFVLAYGAMGGALTTYSRYKGNANYWVSGLLVGLAVVPLIWAGFLWWKLLIRSLCIAIAWGAWCRIFGNDHVQEHGRGFFAGIFDVIV